MFYGIREILTITQPSNLQRFRCQSTIQLETALCYQHCFCNTDFENYNKSRIKGFRSRHNEKRLYSLHLVKLTLDERKTLTKVSTRTTSHNHSPKQAQASDTKEQENQQTRQRAPCIARGENQFPAVCINKIKVVCIIGGEPEALGFHHETTEESRNDKIVSLLQTNKRNCS